MRMDDTSVVEGIQSVSTGSLGLGYSIRYWWLTPWSSS